MKPDSSLLCNVLSPFVKHVDLPSILTFYFFKILFNIYLPLKSSYPKWSFFASVNLGYQKHKCQCCMLVKYR
jgi:hypothetical protein